MDELVKNIMPEDEIAVRTFLLKGLGVKITIVDRGEDGLVMFQPPDGDEVKLLIFEKGKVTRFIDYDDEIYLKFIMDAKEIRTL